MIEMIASTLRLSTPLIFAAMGGLVCERAGIATICLEGVLLTTAWTAATVNYFTHDPWLAIFAAMGVGIFTMSLHAFLSVSAKSDQIISGVVINFLAAGITPMLCKVYFAGPTNTASIPMADRISDWDIPFLHLIPNIGETLFSLNPLIYFALLLPFLISMFLNHTAWGLRLWACGDDPETLKSNGVSPIQVRWSALLAGGLLCSFGGAYLSMGHASQFTRDMSAGRGFIALTALIFGKWKPLPTLAACLFFGFTDALQIQLQSTPLFGISFPVQAIQALPYLVTLCVLVGFIGKAKPPLAIGKS